MTLGGHQSDLFLFLLHLFLLALVLFPTVCLSKGQSLGCLLRMLTSRAERWNAEWKRERERGREGETDRGRDRYSDDRQAPTDFES